MSQDKTTENGDKSAEDDDIQEEIAASPEVVSERADTVSERDGTSPNRLLLRLEALSPIVDDRQGASVRGEILGSAEELRSRMHYWRALVAAAVTPNPWLEPASVLSYLDLKALNPDKVRGPDPKFLLFWHDSGEEDPFRDRRMVCLLPFMPARRGAEAMFGAALGWRPPGGLATPLVHRHHQRAVAAAISHWLRTGDAGFRLLTLEGSGPGERWRVELEHSAASAGVQLETISDAPDCAAPGGWNELFRLGERRTPPPTSSPDVEILMPETMIGDDVADAMAFETVWESAPNEHGQYEIGWLADLRFTHFRHAADEGRLFIGRGLVGERVRAVVLALKSGPDVVLAGVSADPTLAAAERHSLVRRILRGLQARISSYAGVVRMRTGPYADDATFAELFPERLARDTVTLSVSRLSGGSGLARILRRA